MNFGGSGPFQNGQFQNGPPLNPPFGQGVQPPPTGMPVFPGMPMMPMASVHPGMMPSVHPGMMPAAPLQTSYPAGQGPLADRPVQRASNGLLEAPEPEGPEEHDAAQYVKLNPAEGIKYMEYWTQASDGAETVSGTQAVAFLSRAEKVSKGQLRRIWDIADHRKASELDQQQFFIALRLVALAQRGAELSTAGLRNFTGIQLIPKIAPPPKPEPEQPAPEPEKPVFSWTVAPEVVVRYDSFFKTLDVKGVGVIDGKQGVTFFGKSGLPRPTLKKIWGLADVTRDGLLSLDEFRTAMHMVTSIRNKRLTVTALPNVLDPDGPNWLRIAGPEPPAQPPPPVASPQVNVMSSSGSPAMPTVMAPKPPSQQAPSAPQASPSALSPQQHPTSPSNQPIMMPPPQSYMSPSEKGMAAAMPPPAQNVTPGSQAAPTVIPQKQPMSPMQAPLPAQAVRSDAARRAEEEAQHMREALRKERLEVDRARREMEEMKAEMERLRIEKEALAKAKPAVPVPQDRVAKAHPPFRQSHSLSPAAGAAPFSSTPTSSIAASSNPGSSKGTPSLPSATTTFPPQAPRAHSATPGMANQAAQMVRQANPSAPPAPPSLPFETPSVSDIPPERPRGPSTPPSAPSAGQIRDKPIDLGLDDDDIWDQPSPKATAMPGPPGTSITAAAPLSKDELSSDDDDDFWGAAGVGSKPTLGPAGGQKPGQTGSNGFGGSELDDWVF